MLKLAFVGAGNVAWHLAPALESGGALVKGVYSRTAASAQLLAQRLYDTKVFTSPDFSSLEIDIVFLCVPDEAIGPVAAQLSLPKNCALVHVSGAKPMSVLQEKVTNPVGVFYPLQTFSKSKKKLKFSDIPICIEGAKQETLDTLADLAWTVSRQVYHLSSEERLKLHVAAVISCNFTNHLFALADDFLKDTELDFAFLRPLIIETVEKALSHKPAEVQTGPAQRNDESTLNAHEQSLRHHPGIHQVYQFLTRSIKSYYKK